MTELTVERQGFEEWATSRDMWLLPSCNGVGTYCGSETELAWECWLAAKAHLSQPQSVAQGDFSVQVTAERMDEVITSMHGPDGEACAGTLWVGRLDDCGPDGSSRYGIHISCNECPEAGSVTLAEFDASKVVAKGEAVAWRRTDGEGGWFFSEEPSQFDIDLAATYGIIWHPLYATPTIPTGHRVVPVERDGEVSKYKDALTDIQARVASGYFVDANHLGEIAKKALGDGNND